LSILYNRKEALSILYNRKEALSILYTQGIVYFIQPYKIGRIKFRALSNRIKFRALSILYNRKEKKACLVKKHKWRSDRVWVLSHKIRNAEPVSFRALPILYNRNW